MDLFYISFGCYAGSNSWVAKTSCYPIPDFKEKGSLSRMSNDMLFWVRSETQLDATEVVRIQIDF